MKILFFKNDDFQSHILWTGPLVQLAIEYRFCTPEIGFESRRVHHYEALWSIGRTIIMENGIVKIVRRIERSVRLFQLNLTN